MTSILQRNTAVAAPTRQPPPGTLLDCATVQEVDSLWGVVSGGLWESANCGNSTIIPKAFCSDSGFTVTTKTFNPPVWNTAHDFAVYRGLECHAPGFNLGEADLVAAFNAAEGRAVGKAVADIYDPLAQTVSVGTGGGAMSSFAALAEYAADFYGGQPVFLFPAAFAIALQSAQVLIPTPGGGFTTAVGGCVAVAGGINSAMVLGNVLIQRTPLLTQSTVDYTNNKIRLLAERGYLVGVDCDFAAKAPPTVNNGTMP